MTIKDYLIKTSQFLGLDQEEVEVEVDENEDRIRVNLVIPENKQELFIGGADRNIRALQYLTRITFHRDRDKKITLDINDYFQNQDEEFVASIKQDAQQILETGQSRVYQNLNSYQRFLVHTAVGEDEDLQDLTTFSETVGSKRWLTICSKQELEQQEGETKDGEVKDNSEQ